MQRLTVILATIALAAPATVRGAPPAGDPVARAVAFLAREVPRWSRDNHCFSCHNNGDAARALIAATTGPERPPAPALADTLGFLARPERWGENGADAAFSDRRLARLQFAAALASAVEAGAIDDRAALRRAAGAVADDQAADGAWPIVAEGIVGSPATYGRPLATALARQTLRAADPDRFAGPIDRAGRWLRGRAIVNVLDAAAVLLGLSPDDPADDVPRRRALDLLRRAQSEDGGWGPYLDGAPEVFDTALALLALARWPDRAEVAPMLRRGRSYLITTQADDGSWPETTRPPGGESYAQRLSTAGWATLALLRTR